MNRLEALKVFISLAETLHFKETAHRFAVSPQVITRLINELEEELGERLFYRSTRQVKLSEFGADFLPEAADAVARTERLFTRQRPSRQAMSGVVRIALPDIPLMNEVLRRLWQSLAPYPDIRIDWQSRLSLVDVVDEQVDVGIRFGTPQDSRLIVKYAGTTHDCIVASPALIARLGKPDAWQDLHRYPLSALINPNTGRVWAWHLSDDCELVPAKPKFTTNQMNSELCGVINGETVACLPEFMCRPFLADGTLVELFPELPRKQWQAYVYRPSQHTTHPRIAFVFDVLVDALGTLMAGNAEQGDG